jgi:hypothetical protein
VKVEITLSQTNRLPDAERGPRHDEHHRSRPRFDHRREVLQLVHREEPGLEMLSTRQPRPSRWVDAQRPRVDCEVEDLTQDGEAPLHARRSESRGNPVRPLLDNLVGDLGELCLAEDREHVVVQHHPIAARVEGRCPSRVCHQRSTTDSKLTRLALDATSRPS